MKPKHNYTQIIAAVRDGNSYREVAKMFGCCSTTVAKAMRRLSEKKPNSKYFNVHERENWLI